MRMGIKMQKKTTAKEKLITYKASPTLSRFHKSRAFVKGIMGPFGSGKSVGCCFEIFIKAQQQAAGKDGIRRSRWIIARNTLPQLETTTIKTWLDWFPEHLFGRMHRKPPYRHVLKFKDVECEVIFLALDKPDDQKKLLSFEVTGIFFNEAREIPYEIIQAATGRVGRYPAKKDKPDDIPDDAWPTWSGIIMDTNPPDDEHWWYRCDAEEDWARDEFGERIDPSEVDPRYRWEFFQQPSGMAKDAENLANLPNGRGYYMQMLGGKSKEWVDVYVHGQYGFVKHGLPVYGKSWDGDRHTAARININPVGKIYIGVDASGRHPAAVFLQRTMRGQIQAVHELAIQDEEGMGAVSFARLLSSEIKREFPDNDITGVWGDPAGDWKSQNDENTYFDILRAEGINIKASPGLRIPDRTETVKAVLESNVDKDPKFLVSKNCKIMVRGFNGGYRFRKLNVSGENKYDPKPEKNRFSDVQDALQYVLCGMGEMRKMKRGQRDYRKTGSIQANIAFKVF